MSGTNEGIEEVVFSDGVIWTPQTMLALLDNNIPVARNDGIFSVKQGEQIVIPAADLKRNDFDADGETLTIVAVDVLPCWDRATLAHSSPFPGGQSP